jgi:agmatine deiminase
MNNIDHSYLDIPKLRMPAEWETHAGCLMIWPVDALYWQDNLAAVQRDYAGVANAIRAFEPLTMVVRPDAMEDARRLLGSDITLLPLPYNDAWVRDSGPTFVRQEDGALAAVTWRFNGWGATIPDFSDDAHLGRRLGSHVGVPLVNSALAMEGGAIHVDGEGTLLTTDTVVFNDNRNPGITREGAEAEFARTLGIRKTIWLPGNPHEFGTNGHIDGIACFVRPGVVLFETSASSRESYREVTARNFAALKGQTDAQGRKLEIMYVQEAPDADRGKKGGWGYSTSYVNFYIANGGIVMPAFGLPQDDAGKAAIAAAFPDHRISQVDISNLAAGGGGIHCITQQIPLNP